MTRNQGHKPLISLVDQANAVRRQGGGSEAGGLAVDGAAGVQQVIELLRNEIDSAMAQCGQADVKKIGRSLVAVTR